MKCNACNTFFAHNLCLSSHKTNIKFCDTCNKSGNLAAKVINLVQLVIIFKKEKTEKQDKYKKEEKNEIIEKVEKVEKAEKYEGTQKSEKEEDKATNSTWISAPVKASGNAAVYISKLFKEMLNKKKYKDFCNGEDLVRRVSFDI